MIDKIPPAFIILFGALLIPLLRNRRLKGIYMLLLPVASFLHLWYLPANATSELKIFGDLYTLQILRVDKLSLIFGYIFHIAAFLNVIYALHVDDDVQHVSGLLYAGSTIGAVFAGDLVTLFVYWEFTAVTSVFLIWASRTEAAYKAGMRYLIIQIASGVILLAGIIFHYRATNSLAFTKLGVTSFGTALIFIAFGMKCAFPLLHNWLQDAYPQGTVTGTVFLSAFTTKLAVYALARGFAGTEILIPIGATMTAFPIFFAEVENDLRKVLSYSLNNQLGFMVVGIGIGTPMAINGAAAHAFCHILYKALLFMSMGAVLYRTGTIKAHKLGGLYKSMPWTTGFCVVGAASISAFPLFSGFVSKSLILAEAANHHYTVTWMVLLFASAGVLHHSGIKIPYSAFFGEDKGIRCKEAPFNMLVAMGITAALCVGIGCYYQPLYQLLPFAQKGFNPYTSSHVITQFQLLLWSALAFAVLKKTGLYPPKRACINLDFDWSYRKAIPVTVNFIRRHGGQLWNDLLYVSRELVIDLIALVYQYHGPTGVFGRTLLTGAIALWAALLLGLYLLFYFI